MNSLRTFKVFGILTRPFASDRSDDSRSRSNALTAAFVTGIGSKVLTTVCGFAAIGIAVRDLGSVEYGIIATLAGITGIFGFLDFGIGNATIFEVSQHYARRDFSSIRKLLANTLVFLFSMGALILALAVPAILMAPTRILFDAPGVAVDEVRWALIVFTLSTAIAIPSSLGARVALGIQRGALNNYVGLVSGVGSLILVLICVWLGASLIFFVICFILLPALVNLVQTIWILARNRGQLRPLWSGVTMRGVVGLFGKGLPFMALAFAGAATYQTDALVVIYILGASAAATFGVVLKLFTGITSLFSGGLQQMWASVAHALAANDMVWVRKAFRVTFLITMTLYTLATLVLVVFGHVIVGLWAGTDVVPGFDLLLAFGIWNTYNFGMSQFSMLLNGANKVGTQAITSCLMAVVNFPLTLLLTHAVGLPGPLYASLISHGACVGLPTILMVWRMLRSSPVDGPEFVLSDGGSLAAAGRHWSRRD